MGRLPGVPGDWRSSPAFWSILCLSLLVMLVGAAVAGFSSPQHGGVLVSVGVAGLALTAAIAGMASLRSRRDPDERLREAP
ncbi:MAG TPA: hypothetical protein VIS07_11205 [Candidatus Binatia bacterium]